MLRWGPLRELILINISTFQDFVLPLWGLRSDPSRGIRTPPPPMLCSLSSPGKLTSSPFQLPPLRVAGPIPFSFFLFLPFLCFVLPSYAGNFLCPLRCLRSSACVQQVLCAIVSLEDILGLQYIHQIIVLIDLYLLFSSQFIYNIGAADNSLEG